MNYEPHEYANLFPMMSGDELKTLVEDMLRNGFDESSPIVLFQNKILDGRNRLKAAIEAKVKPVFDTFKGSDPLGFVIRHNLNRRHLTSSQRAAVGVDLEAVIAKEAKEKEHERKTTFQKIEKSPVHAAKEAAKALGTNTQYIVDAKKVKEADPRMFEQVLAGNLTLVDAKKELKAQERTEARAEIAKIGRAVKPSERWHVINGDIETVELDKQFDFIITDPPYPKEYLHLYDVLAYRANEWLKEGGLLIAMCGQSYLDEIYTMMSKHIEYYWTAAYLTPGQPTPLRQVNVNTTWKPLLIFKKGNYKGKIFGDVFVSDGNDKSMHKWGQSESGMYSIVSKMCLEGQSILDPFCGAGTTGVAALKHGCLFTGIEKELENCLISNGRLSEL